MLASVIAYVIANKAALAMFLFLLSEAIGMLPGVKASGVFQAVFNVVSAIYKAVLGKEPPKVEEG